MEALNTQLLRLFDWLLWTTIQGSVLVVLIVLVQKILRRRLPARWHYLLWVLLLVRLTVPWLPESKISIFNLVPRSIQHGQIIESISQRDQSGRFGFYSGMRFTGTEEPKPQSDSRTIFAKSVRMAPLLWLLGTLVIAGYVCARSISLWWTVKRERPITDSQILDLLEDCKMQMGIQTILGVIVSDRIKSPALFGFVRPRLLLPQGMLETYNLEELRYVFVHELAHLRQRDIYLGWLMALLQIVHWFNPLMWFAFGRIRADRELACDTLAISTLAPHEPPEYGRTIVSLLQSFSQVRYLPSVAGILQDTCQIERRIKMIADYKKTSRKSWAGAMLLLVVLACVVLTNAYVAKADFEFGEPVNMGSVISVLDPAHDFVECLSYDALELYIMSDRAGGYGDADIWVLRRASKDDDWGPPENLGPAVNSPSADARASISVDGLTLYFNSVNRAGGYGNCDIYAATRATKNDPWGKAVLLEPPINRTGSNALDAEPWISPDDLELYFRSNRSGAQADIYLARRATRGDPWETPVNLGPVVNSPYYDVLPSLSPDGLLLLFCDSPWGQEPRPGGYGNGDVWMARRASLSAPWQASVNLGPRVNSPAMDAAPRISPDGRTLYFITLRDGSLENWQASIIPVCDFNGDGKVDIADVSIMVEHWHTDYSLCDIGPMPWGDGFVDAQDLSVLAEYLSEDSRPAAHWKLDEDQGSTAYDSAGRNDAELHGEPVWQPAGGKEGGALQFDGADDYVSTPFILDPAKGSFSVFAWIKSSARGQVIISQNDSTGTRWLWTDPSYGRLTTWLMHPPFDPLMSGSTITDGQWHHVGMVYDSIGLKRHLYIDGAEAAKDFAFVGGVSSNGGLYLGADKTLEPASFFSGLIDDVRIYDEVLSAEEVAELAR